MLMVLAAVLLVGVTVFAQQDYAASLEVLTAGVTVQRVNTANPIAVSVEAIVGVGDVIRTDAQGTARITFFADGTDVTLQPNTVYRIERFAGQGDTFSLTVEVLAGQALHRLQRVLNSGSSYDVKTPGMTLAARGTAFAVRVEETGRSAVIVSEGTVSAADADSDAAVPAGYGVRAEVEGKLSEVVAATSFDQLDSALDGCAATVTTPDDVSLNVRKGPSRDNELLGTVFADTISVFYGVSQAGGWYRIPFEDGYGWVLSPSATVRDGCAGLRLFPDTYQEGQALTPTVLAADAAPAETPAP
jgi:hypothetical protein